MSGYNYAEFFRRVQGHQLAVRGRTEPTGCWVCDVLLPVGHNGSASLPGFAAALRAARRRCEKISGVEMDAHHVLPKRVIRDEYPWGRAIVPADLVLGARPEAVGERQMDPRNGILVRRYHHDALEARRLAIPVAMLPQDTLEFVDELELRWWLENQEARRAVG